MSDYAAIQSYVEGTFSVPDAWYEKYGYPGDYSGGSPPWPENDIKEIVLESGITSIGLTSFGGLPQLTSVKLPNTIRKIERAAFASDDKLVTINIPDSVKYIGMHAFDSCDSLTNIYIPQNVESMTAPFSNCASLTYILVCDENQYYTQWNYQH